VNADWEDPEEAHPMKQRRHFTPEFKARVVLDILTGVQTPAEACRKHSLSPNLPSLWKAAFLERAPLVFQADERRDGQEARIAELERVLGRLTLENEVLKKVSSRLP
jgi:transposase-like protein